MNTVLAARRILSASFVVVLLLCTTLGASIVRADSTTYAWAGREHLGWGWTLGDSIPAYASVHGVHDWSMWIYNDQSSSAFIVDPHITVTSPVESSRWQWLEGSQGPPSISTSGPNTIYDWTFSSVAPGSDCWAEMGGYPPYTYSPMFDSNRTVSPSVISSATTVQTLTVRVIPRFAFDWVWVRVGLMWPDVVTPSFISAIPAFNSTGSWDGSPWGRWQFKSYPDKEYVVSCMIQVTNNAYPETVYYEPRVSVGCWEYDDRSSSLVGSSTGSSIAAQDSILGSISYSASGSYQWNYEAQEGRYIDYLYASGYGSGVLLGESESSLLYASENSVYFIHANPARMTLPGAAYDSVGLGAIYGLCASDQLNVFDDDPNLVETAGIGGGVDDLGKPKFTGKSIVLCGSGFPNGPNYVMGYYSYRSKEAPIKDAYSATDYMLQTQDGATVASKPFSWFDGHHDLIAIMVFTDSQNNYVMAIYGYSWLGTWAGTIYFARVIAHNLASYPYRYIVLEWADANGDGVPQAGELTEATHGQSIMYDDGERDGAWSIDGGWRGHGVRFTPPVVPWFIDTIAIYGQRYGEDREFSIEIWDTDRNDLLQIGPWTYSRYFLTEFDWAEIPVSIKVTGDFYICVFTSSTPTTGIYIGYDADPPHYERSYIVRSDTNEIMPWTITPPREEMDWMIRAMGHASESQGSEDFSLHCSAQLAVPQFSFFLSSTLLPDRELIRYIVFS